MTLSEVLSLVISRLDDLQIPYMIVGSFASSAYGPIRSTQDADLIVNMRPEKVGDFVRTFSMDFYVDQSQVEQAIAAKRSVNIIHLGTFFKVDCFILSGTPFMREEFSRRVSRRLEMLEKPDIWLATAEDTVLSKLSWYREGGEVSDLQWRDVTAILKA